MYDLFDINGDYIPELFISDGGFHVSYCHVYSFIDSECVKILDDNFAYGTLYAVPEKNLIIHYSTQMGYSSLYVNKFNGKEALCIDTFNDNIMNADYETVYYKRNNTEVTAYEYISAYNSYIRNNTYSVGRQFNFNDISAINIADNYKNSSHDVYNITPLPETELPAPLNLGEINSDGIIDASDASLILAEYAASSTNSLSLLNEAQKKAADVNNDGLIDASDASSVLAYYSYISTGGTESLEVFIEYIESSEW